MSALLLGLFCGLGVSFFVLSGAMAVAAAALAGQYDEGRDVHDTRPAWMSDFDGEWEGS